MTTDRLVEPIRVIIADDHLVVRSGMKALVSGASDIQVVGEAANGREALALIERVTPHVAVLDLDMPVTNGLAVLRTLSANGSRTRVLIVTMHDDADSLARLLEAGAAGYLIKSVAERELVQAIRAVASGADYPHATASRAVAARLHEPISRRVERMSFDALSVRERDVLVLVAEGYSAAEIGDRLLISRKTVETYKQRLSEKLALHHRSSYVQFCLRLDLLQAHT